MRAMFAVVASVIANCAVGCSCIHAMKKGTVQTFICIRDTRAEGNRIKEKRETCNIGNVNASSVLSTYWVAAFAVVKNCDR